MSPLTLLVVAFSISITVSYGHLRLEKICDGGDQTGTNLTLVHADGELDCARACDLNMDCNFMSYHANNCAMHRNEPACETGVAATEALYKVDPQCTPGWHRYGGSCYFVVESELPSFSMILACLPRGAVTAAVRSEAENDFLVHLLHSRNISNTTTRLGGEYYFLTGEGDWSNHEPWMFQNWADGEPGSGPCIAMNTDDGKWQTEDCSQGMVGICEKTL